MALVRHRLDLLIAEMAAFLTESRIWDEDGYTTPIQWLRTETNLATGVACQHVGVGLSLGIVPQSVEALERGEIGFGHLALMADTASFYRAGSFGRPAATEMVFTRQRATRLIDSSRFRLSPGRHPDGGVASASRRSGTSIWPA